MGVGVGVGIGVGVSVGVGVDGLGVGVGVGARILNLGNTSRALSARSITSRLGGSMRETGSPRPKMTRFVSINFPLAFSSI